MNEGKAPSTPMCHLCRCPRKGVSQQDRVEFLQWKPAYIPAFPSPTWTPSQAQPPSPTITS